MGKFGLKPVEEDMTCSNPECGKPLPFGTYAYVFEDEEKSTKRAICPDCGVERGWTSKQVAKTAILLLEMNREKDALRRQIKIYRNTAVMLRAQVDVFRLGENDMALEKENLKLMQMFKDYMINAGGTAKEQELFNKVQTTIEENRELQQDTREAIKPRLFVLNEPMPKNKKRDAEEKAVEEEEEEVTAQAE